MVFLLSLFYIVLNYFLKDPLNLSCVIIFQMDISTISNKTTCTEVEEVTNGELTERYYLLKKQYENLSLSYESTKQELHDTRRSYHTALDVQRHLTVELEGHQVEEERRRNEMNNRFTTLQEDISSLREEKAELLERHAVEISRLQDEIRRLKDEVSCKVDRSSPEKDTGELEEVRSAAAAAQSEANSAKAALEEARAEISNWKMRTEALAADMEQMQEAAEIRREKVRAANERETVALAELTEMRAMMNQCIDSQSLEPHATKGNSLFAEVEDKRQEMAKTLIQMKQTNSKLRRDLANKQAELDALLHEKQTLWEQQLGASAHYDRELIESYEERISQLEALAERQRRELLRWFSKAEPDTPQWLPGVLDHLKTECLKLRGEVLSRGAAQLAAAAHVRELRRRLAALTNGQPPAKPSPDNKQQPDQLPDRLPDQSRNSVDRITDERKITVDQLEKEVRLKEEPKKFRNLEDVRKKVTFN